MSCRHWNPGDATDPNSPGQNTSSTSDTGRLHVAAAVLPGVESERIVGAAETFNGDSLLAILRKLYPRRTFPENFMSGLYLYEVVPRTRAGESLQCLGREGWVSLEDSVRANTEDLAEE